MCRLLIANNAEPYINVILSSGYSRSIYWLIAYLKQDSHPNLCSRLPLLAQHSKSPSPTLRIHWHYLEKHLSLYYWVAPIRQSTLVALYNLSHHHTTTPLHPLSTIHTPLYKIFFATILWVTQPPLKTQKIGLPPYTTPRTTRKTTPQTTKQSHQNPHKLPHISQTTVWETKTATKTPEEQKPHQKQPTQAEKTPNGAKSAVNQHNNNIIIYNI